MQSMVVWNGLKATRKKRRKKTIQKRYLFLVCKSGHIEVAKWIYSIHKTYVMQYVEDACDCSNENVIKWLNSFKTKN